MNETEEQQKNDGARYELEIGETVYVKSTVREILPNCIVVVEPYGFRGDTVPVTRVHRNMITKLAPDKSI